MAYVSYGDYTGLYGENAIDEKTFNRLSWYAEKKIDINTTGVDGVKKLKIAFPAEEEDIAAIKRCAMSLIDIMYRIEQAEENLKSAQGYVKREDGSLQGKIVSSVSAGSESIHYAVGNETNAATLIDMVLSDKTAQEKLYKDTIFDCLSGVMDANGVNLLYMGRYPYRVR